MSDQNTDLKHVSDDALKEMVMIQNRIKQLGVKEKSQTDFIEYVKHVWDGFIEGEHHKLFAEKLERVAQGKCKRLIVNMPPRHTKSEFASVNCRLGLAVRYVTSWTQMNTSRSSIR